MIVVNIDLWPFGSKPKRKPLSKILIYNDGTGNVDEGNYKYFITHPDLIPPEDPKEIETISVKKGSIKRFKRLRGHQALVAAVIRDAKL